MNIEFVKLFPSTFRASIAVVVISILLFFVKGLNYGIDFSGGSILHLRFEQPTAESTVLDLLKKVGAQIQDFDAGKVVIQPVADELGVKTDRLRSREFIVQYPVVGLPEHIDQVNRTIREGLRSASPTPFDVLEETSVGPTIGREMKKDAAIAAVLSVIGILIYMAWRFEINSSLGAVIALAHDGIITIGFLCLVGQEFDVTVLAALLTLLGYSINDSIVVLDRIRENRKLIRNEKLANIVDISINQTLSRTINTSLTTAFTLVSLLLFGGQSIYGFALALTFGLAVGTYSSMFIASPIMLWLSERERAARRRGAEA